MVYIFLKLSESYQVQIYNVYGEKMAVGAHCNVPLRIDVSYLPNGMYFLKLSKSYQVQIYNVYGEKMRVGAHCNVPLRIDVSGLPNGIYFLKLSESSELSESYYFQKFVVIK